MWIDNGAEWHYDWDAIWWVGFDKFNYTGDTLIDGQFCQKIESVRYTFYPAYPGSPVIFEGTGALAEHYTYVSGDTVFWRDQGQFFVMLNFGAVPGDQWMVSTDPASGDCDDTSYTEVVDTGTVIINSTSYRYIDIQPTSNSPIGHVGRFVERFGNMSSGFGYFSYPFPSWVQCDSLTGIYEWGAFAFKCFSDDSFTLYNPSGEDCEYLWTHLDISEIGSQEFLIYPNPVVDDVTIQSNGKPYDLLISNSSGQILYSQYEISSSEYVVDLSRFESGIFFLRIESAGEILYKKILKH